MVDVHTAQLYMSTHRMSMRFKECCRDAGRSPEPTRRLSFVGNDDAGNDAAPAAEPEPADNLAEWVRALNAAAGAAEQAAADAEAAAGGPGSWFSRTSACIEAEARATAAATRVSSLTVGDNRPGYVPVRAGREAYIDLVILMDAAQQRARAACSSMSNRADRHQRCGGPGRGSAGPGQGRRGGCEEGLGVDGRQGFYTSEQYGDCNRYRGDEAFEDQPEACRHANGARALAEVVRWRANRAQTVAEHARALAYETRSLALRAEAERRSGGRRRLLAEAEQLQEQATETLAAVREAYAEQHREWQGLQARAARWLEDAEHTYAANRTGRWQRRLGERAARRGDRRGGRCRRASALGLTGSEALELATTVAGADAGAGGDGTLTQAAVTAVGAGGVMPPVAGTAAGADPTLDEAFDSIEAGLLTRADDGRPGAGRSMRAYGRPRKRRARLVAGEGRRVTAPVEEIQPPTRSMRSTERSRPRPMRAGSARTRRLSTSAATREIQRMRMRLRPGSGRSRPRRPVQPLRIRSQRWSRLSPRSAIGKPRKTKKRAVRLTPLRSIPSARIRLRLFAQAFAAEAAESSADERMTTATPAPRRRLRIRSQGWSSSSLRRSQRKSRKTPPRSVPPARWVGVPDADNFESMDVRTSRRAALDPRVTTEIAEHPLHLRRQSVQEVAAPVPANRTNASGLPQQPASGTALHENETTLLVLEDGPVPDAKVVPEQFGQLRTAERLRQTRLGNQEVTDDVQSRLAMEVPAIETRIEYE